MIHVSFADPETGLFDGRQLVAPNRETVQLNARGRLVVDGVHDHRNKRFDLASQTVVDYQPPQPSPDHVWDADDQLWKLSPEAEGVRLARRAARQNLSTADARAVRALIEHALGDPAAVERLRTLEANKVQLRSKL